MTYNMNEDMLEGESLLRECYRLSRPQMKNKMSPQLQILTPITHCNMKTEMRLEEQSPNFDHIYHTHLLSAYLLISARSLLSSCLHAVSE